MGTGQMAITRRRMVTAMKLIYHLVLRSVFTENLLEVELLASSLTGSPLHSPSEVAVPFVVSLCA